jgi:competence protein ComEC
MLQYTKTKLTKKGNPRTYQVLKLKSDSGLNFYTIASKKLPLIKGKKVEMEIWAGGISFLEYLRTFFGFSKILRIYDDDSLQEKVAQNIASQHQDENLSQLYNALILATPLSRELQTHFSALGVSHVIAISGFHLGLLWAVLYFLIKYPYRWLQARYFPYRNMKRDTFLLIVCVLFAYMLFLETPPSLLRAFGMLVVGFFLYDRGVEIISMQTLFVTILLLLSLFPTLIFSLGFWLSSFGVFYIFLFLRSNWKIFIIDLIN